MSKPFIAMIIPMGDAPGYPGHDLPTPPVYPGHGLPGGGQIDNTLPDLPPDPARPGQPIHLPPQIGTLPIYPVSPGHDLPMPPGSVYPPLPGNVPSGKALALVAISGVGYRWTVIDTSLSAGMPLPGGPPPLPGQPLPPTAAPKR